MPTNGKGAVIARQAMEVHPTDRAIGKPDGPRVVVPVLAGSQARLECLLFKSMIMLAFGCINRFLCTKPDILGGLYSTT